MPDDHVFEVLPADAGKRLDVFVTERLGETSRSSVQRWIEAGLATIDDVVARAGSKLRVGSRVRVAPLPPVAFDLVPQDMVLDILFEDESLIVVDKPAGLVVHPGAGNRTGTLANALAHHFQELSAQGGLRPGIVHRLDKQTSGVLVVAKNDWVHEQLALQFKKREVEKIYLALVHGRMEPPNGEIDIPLGRHPTSRTKMSTRSRRARPARTEFETIRVFDRFSYLKVKLHTGRTHQIRVHLEHLGHPVVGDDVYGAASRESDLKGEVGRVVRELNRHFLHAARLSFRHPVSGQSIGFASPLPSELADLLHRLG